MKAVVQKVKIAKVKVDDQIVSEIGRGLLVLVAISNTDNIDIIKWMANKIVNLRVFPDNDDKMNKSVLEINGEIMMISNFTVYGDLRKGFRPNFMKSAPANISKPLYLQLISLLRKNYPLRIEDGEFGAMMDVELVNDGPVTIILEKEAEID